MPNDQSPPDVQTLLRELQLQRDELRALSFQVHGLVEAWQTAQGVVKFMKLIGSMATAAAAVWALAALALERKG